MEERGLISPSKSSVTGASSSHSSSGRTDIPSWIPIERSRAYSTFCSVLPRLSTILDLEKSDMVRSSMVELPSLIFLGPSSFSRLDYVCDGVLLEAFYFVFFFND